MFKFIILTFIALWILGLFLGRKRRIIKDIHQLLTLIIWAAIAFVGLTTLAETRPLGDGVLARIALSALWLLVSWPIARLLTSFLSR